MAYTTEAKVASMFRDITFSTTSAVTSAEVVEFISEADAEIDCVLAPYYTVPLTGSESLLIVGKISRWLVAHEIKTILEVDLQVSDKEQDVQSTNLRKKALKLLNDCIPQFNKTSKRYEQPVCQLSDTDKKATPPENESIFRSHIGVNDSPRVIKKGGSNGLGGKNW